MFFVSKVSASLILNGDHQVVLELLLLLLSTASPCHQPAAGVGSTAAAPSGPRRNAGCLLLAGQRPPAGLSQDKGPGPGPPGWLPCGGCLDAAGGPGQGQCQQAEQVVACWSVGDQTAGVTAALTGGRCPRRWEV